MANPEHLEILKEGVEAWNKWREFNPFVTPNLINANLNENMLSRAQLYSADLRGADLSAATLRGANLEGANLGYADLRGAKLDYAGLRGAKLGHADLYSATLRGANLRDAKLDDANLNSATLRGADVTGAVFNSTIITRVDLSEVKGLEKTRHIGPSQIGIDTLYESEGKIPTEFLRQCGVPDDFIAFIPSHFGAQQAIQFYSCFISYSSKEEDFARRLYSRMRDEKLRVWFAPEDIKGGEKLHEQLERAIQLHDRLLIILSEHSMQSEWVMTELRKARKQEIQQKRRKLFPIRLATFDEIRKWECFDADTGKDLAVELREYFIPDFSNWKDHDSFEASFERLLKDLRAAETR